MTTNCVSNAAPSGVLSRTVIERHAVIGAAERSPAEGACISADGSRVGVHSDRDVRLWDVRVSGMPTLLLRLDTDTHANLVRGVALSADGEVLATASLDKYVRLWRIRRRSPESEPPSVLGTEGLANKCGLSGIPQLTPGKPIRLEGHTSGVLGVALSDDAMVCRSLALTCPAHPFDNIPFVNLFRSCSRIHLPSCTCGATSPALGCYR